MCETRPQVCATIHHGEVTLGAIVLSVMALATGAAGCGNADDPTSSQTDQGLTHEQCSYFSEGDRVTICHRTNSTWKPFAIIRTNVASCGGHSLHAGDYVAWNDPTCSGQGCFPEGAPFDNSVECCDGLAPDGGYCRDLSPSRSLSLNGTGQLASTTNTGINIGLPVTYEAWAYSGSATDTGGRVVVSERLTMNSVYTPVQIARNGGVWKCTFTDVSTVPVSQVDLITNVPVVAGTWTHLAFALSETSQDCYVNGILRAHRNLSTILRHRRASV